MVHKPVPVTIDGKKLYRIGDALQVAGLSRPTYFRWVRTGRVSDTHYRDRNGRRVFTPAELHAMRALAQRLVVTKGKKPWQKRTKTK